MTWAVSGRREWAQALFSHLQRNGRASTPEMWDKKKKSLALARLHDWQARQADAAHLQSLARTERQSLLDKLTREGLTEEEMVALDMTEQDMKVASLWASEPEPRVPFPSSMGRTASLSHAQALADMKCIIPVHPGSAALLTGSEPTPGQQQTYRRIQNARKRLRRAIRAGGGQA